MKEYEVYVELGIYLVVETDSAESALAFTHGALQVHALPGYNVRLIDKYVVEDSVKSK